MIFDIFIFHFLYHNIFLIIFKRGIIETKGNLYVSGQWFYRPEEADKKESGCWVARDTRELFYRFDRFFSPVATHGHFC